MLEWDTVLGLHIPAGQSEGVLALPNDDAVLVGWAWSAMLNGVPLGPAAIDPRAKSAVSLLIQSRPPPHSGPVRRSAPPPGARPNRRPIPSMPFVIGPGRRLVVEIERSEGDAHFAFHGKRFRTVGLAMLHQARLAGERHVFGALAIPG